MVFSFKRFNVYNDLPAMKVGTDGVLLGTLVSLPGFVFTRVTRVNTNPAPFEVLDIGTGTGVVALILAQRLADAGVPAHITGIDIDSSAADSAAKSFAESPWSDTLTARCVSLADYADRFSYFTRVTRVNTIVSNPPYYDRSLECADERRNMARHTESLSWREVVTFAGEFLAEDGRLAMILPKQEERVLLRFAASFGLKAVRLVSICTTENKPPRRLIAEFVRQKVTAEGGITASISRETVVIGDETYRNATEEFYL